MKAWGGRFKGETNPLMERYSASIDFDWALFEYDIEGSKAHAEMLAHIGILDEKERDGIIRALDEIKMEIREGRFEFSASMEDIHMHVEARLIEKTGEAGKKLHTGRSRNDQVSLDMRLFLKHELRLSEMAVEGLLVVLLEKGSKEKGIFMPGYTHMQKAQVVPFSHYLLAYYYMFQRDRERLKGVIRAIDVLPLGSGALAGSTIPLDREFVRQRLGFSRVSENSMDAVADRDFVLDAVFANGMVMTHLSRLSEDLIIFSTEEFGFVSLPDELCTGSSLMPHKKNPDALELTRGKTSRVIGDLMSLFALLKGLPMTYNRDLQEDKEPLFHAVATVKDALAIMTLCIQGMEINGRRMEEAAIKSFMAAVEMAEYLTLKGVPFREAHTITGRMVRACEEKGVPLASIGIEEMKTYSGAFEDDIYDHIEPRRILSNRRTTGAASFAEVEKELDAETAYLHH